MRRAILTGFGLFGNYPFNPVLDATREYDNKKVGDIEVVGLVLPSAYDSFDILSAEIDRRSPDIILETGFASRVPRITLEAFGKNMMYHERYADSKGLKPDHEPIIKNGEPYYRTNVDNVGFAKSLDAHGIPAEVSVNADTFICNALLYLTARRIELEGLNIKHAYFHTPATENYRGRPQIEGKPTIPKEHLNGAIEILLKEMERMA